MRTSGSFCKSAAFPPGCRLQKLVFVPERLSGSWNCLALVGLNLSFLADVGVGWNVKLDLASSSTVVMGVGWNWSVVSGDGEVNDGLGDVNDGLGDVNDGLVDGGVTGAEVDDNKTKLGKVSSRAGGNMVVLRPLK